MKGKLGAMSPKVVGEASIWKLLETRRGVMVSGFTCWGKEALPFFLDR